ncbi:MAG TPA: hypothetical protein VFU30_13925 [Gaiellaceae bacterium]|nr:hypothetical protein [Gaiellaceae bacterium]
MTKLSLAAISLAFILAACGGSSHARSGAHAVGKVKATVLPHGYTTRFAGFLPPVGARATLPAHGKTLFEVPGGILYADGHIITDRGVQRLTPWGARLLWSKIRAIGLAAGLFRHHLEAAVASHHHIDRWYQVCDGRQLISAHVGTSARAHPRHPMPPGQGRALARIDTLFATATSRLPARAWADRMIRPYVPSHYDLGFDHPGPDPAMLPSPAREELAKYKPLLHDASQGITTAQARTLITAFVKSGVKTVRGWGELNFRLPTPHPPAFGGNYAVLRFNQDVPGSDTFHHKYCKY